MSIATVAQYVEAEEIRARIATLGFDYGQDGLAPLADLLGGVALMASMTVVTRLPVHWPKVGPSRARRNAQCAHNRRRRFRRAR
jgi:hypothetical protein